MNAPNLISSARLVLAPVAAAAVIAQQQTFALVIVGLALASDVADGWLARRRGETTRLGKMLDPVADKVFVVGLLAALIYSGRVPLALAAVIVVRDLCVLTGAWLRIRRGDPVPVANYYGKFAFAVLGVYLVGEVGGVRWPTGTAVGVGSIYVLTALSYARRSRQSDTLLEGER